MPRNEILFGLLPVGTEFYDAYGCRWVKIQPVDQLENGRILKRNARALVSNICGVKVNGLSLFYDNSVAYLDQVSESLER